jgi:hypothetical protein
MMKSMDKISTASHRASLTPNSFAIARSGFSGRQLLIRVDQSSPAPALSADRSSSDL